MILEESMDRCGRLYWAHTTESTGSIIESRRVLENLGSLWDEDFWVCSNLFVGFSV